MKVKITKKTEEVVEIDVTFPLYFSMSDQFDTGCGYKAVIRIEEDGSTFEVTERDNFGSVSEYAIEKDTIDLSRELSGFLFSSMWELSNWEQYIVLQNDARLYLETFPTV